MADFDRARLHVVSGKGGTGKSTVAAALALALAARGRKVLLIEVEGRQGIAQLFDVPPLPYEERPIALAPGGQERLYALAIDPEAALLDYLHMFYKLSPTGLPARTLRRMGAIEFATTVAPGLRDVLLTGKAKELVGRTRKSGGQTYDAVVMDAPPTGRIARFLNITHEVGGLTKVGPIKTQSDGVMQILRSHETAVHLVTLLEEMPVQETRDAVSELEELDLPVGGVVVNMVREPMLTAADLATAERGEIDETAVRRSLTAAGLPVAGDVARALIAQGGEHAQRVALEERGRDALADLGRPTYELPLVEGPVDLGALYALAESLCEQGMA